MNSFGAINRSIVSDAVRRLGVLFSAGAVAACSPITGSDGGEEPALLRYYGENAQIIMPDTAKPGQEFTIKIRTFGGGCTREVSRTVIDRSLGTDLYLYNRTTGKSVCTADLIPIEHQAVLKFDAVGDYSVRFFGTNRGGETRERTVDWMLDRHVAVRNIPGVLVVPLTMRIAVGQTIDFTATAIPSVSNPRWTWMSSHPANLSVDSTGFARALLGPRSGISVCAELVGDPTMRGCASVLIVPP